MAWEPGRRYNFFFSPPAHLCAATYMTEISLIVTLNNQFNPIQILLPSRDMAEIPLKRRKSLLQSNQPTAHKCAGGLKMMLG